MGTKEGAAATAPAMSTFAHQAMAAAGCRNPLSSATSAVFPRSLVPRLNDGYCTIELYHHDSGAVQGTKLLMPPADRKVCVVSIRAQMTQTCSCRARRAARL